jgi:hypothetical protein
VPVLALGGNVCAETIRVLFLPVEDKLKVFFYFSLFYCWRSIGVK